MLIRIREMLTEVKEYLAIFSHLLCIFLKEHAGELSSSVR